MAKQNDAWGIEVGANAIKAMRLIRKKDDIVLAEYEVLPFKKVLTTPDLNVDEAIQVNLDQFLSRHEVNKSTVVVSVPGHMAFARFAKLPPVDPKKIPDIVKFEAVQQIPFPIDQVEWDYQVFSQADSPDVEVGIVAITKERVNRFLDNFNAVGMEPDGVVLSPMAVYNGLVYDMGISGDSPGMIIADIGTTSTDVIIVENERIWLRTLPIGGNNFTEALVRSFKLSFPKAERLKREAGTSKYARQIFQAMRPVFADLVQEMQRSLGYYQSLNRDSKLTRLVGVGSTFRLPGMQKFLKQQLQMEVVRPDKYLRIKVPGKQEADFAEHAMNMATAYGLAIQGLGLESVTTNVLPKPIARRQVWRSKSPWFAAAAAVLFAASIAATGRYYMEKSTIENRIEETDRITASTRSQAQQFTNQWNTATREGDPRGEIDQLRDMLDYRSVLPMLLYDLDLAAQSLGPQVALLSTDYEAMSRIPMDERRRVYIEEVKLNYAPAPGVQLPKPESETGEEAGPKLAQWSSNQTAPTYTVQLRGYTPYKGYLELIGEEYVGWLQSNAERLNRPYRLIVEEYPLVWTSFPEDGQDNRGTAARTNVARGQPGFGEDTGRDDLLGRGTARLDANRGDARQDPNQRRRIDPTESLARPENVEAAGVARFTITWQVQLVKPEDIRRIESELAAYGPDGAPPPPPEPEEQDGTTAGAGEPGGLSGVEAAEEDRT